MACGLMLNTNRKSKFQSAYGRFFPLGSAVDVRRADGAPFARFRLPKAKPDVGALVASAAAGVLREPAAMAASGESIPASALVAATPALALLLLWSALLLIVLIGWYKR